MRTDRGGAEPRWLRWWDNPFLTREWRRSRRQRLDSLPAALALTALAVLAFAAVVTGGAALSLTPNDPDTVVSAGATALSDGARSVGIWLIGALAWLFLALGGRLAGAQTDLEERQGNLDLLLVTPLRRARLVGLLLGWPLVNVVLYLLPLTPLLLLLMPFLGLSFSGALRLLAVLFGGALLTMVRAPAGTAVVGGQRRSGLEVGGRVLAVLVLVPAAGQVMAEWLGLPGWSLVRWPLALSDALASHRPFWSGETWLGGWLLALYALVLVARLLSAWTRLSAGGERWPVPPAAAATPALLLLAWVLAGLAWPRGGAGAELRLWSGLQLLVVAWLWRPLLTPDAPPWHVLWWVGPRCAAAGWRALLRLADTCLLVAGAAVVWRLGLAWTGVRAAWPTSDTLLDSLAAAVLAAGWTEALQRAAGAGERERGGARWWRLTARAWVAGWVIWGLWRLSAAASEADGWSGAFFGWAPPVAAVVVIAGLLAAWLPLALGPEATGDEGPAWLWRCLPRRLRDNPLAVKAHRTMRRRGLTRLTAVSMIALGGLGLLPLRLPLDTLSAGAAPPLWLALVIACGAVGKWLGWQILGLHLAARPALLLGEAFLTVAAGSGPVLLWTATLCGRVVTAERWAGSLGLLLLSDLSDREVAEGLLVGQLYPVLEGLWLLALVLTGWSLAAGHWAVAVASLVAWWGLWGAVEVVAGVAFLGTARYVPRAAGALTAVATVAVGLLAALQVLGVTASVLSGQDHDVRFCWSGLLLGVAALAVVVGRLLVGAAEAAVGRLRRAVRLWRAFEVVA